MRIMPLPVEEQRLVLLYRDVKSGSRTRRRKRKMKEVREENDSIVFSSFALWAYRRESVAAAGLVGSEAAQSQNL